MRHRLRRISVAATLIPVLSFEAMKMNAFAWAANSQTFARKLKLTWLIEPFALRSALFFAALSFAFFARLLFNNTGAVWSESGNDLTLLFIPWYTFGFQEMLHGNFPLWNPHNFCGTPFFSNLNSGMLYPLHLLLMVLPFRNALNLILTVNIALSGWFTSLWVRNRGISALGSIVAGVIFMFSGAYFQHTFPGHEPVMASMALAPLVFLCIDAIFYDAAWQWILLGMLAVGLQCMTGYPQAVYYTALMSTLYVAMRIVFYEHRLLILRRFFLIYAGGAMLAAVQLLPALQTAGESVRQSNNFEFAASCPLPPENLIHLLAPSMLGDGQHSQYIGTWYPWEISVFCGISTLVLAVAGATFGDGRKRRFSGTLLVISVVLALGVNIRPVFTALYYGLPLFGSFRTTARFNWFMTLYLAMLAGIGFDVLLIACRASWRPMILVGFAALLLSGLALGLHRSAHAGIDGEWGRFVRGLAAAKEHIFPITGEIDDGFAATTGDFAATQLYFSAGTLVAMCAALALLRVSTRFSLLVAAVTVTELTIFANSIFASGPMYLPYPANWRSATERMSRDSRVLHPTLEYPNTAMVYGFNDLYGYDALALKRYSDFIAATQDRDPDQTNFATQFERVKYPNLFQLLRCQYVFYLRDALDGNKHPIQVSEILSVDNPLPQVLLMPQYAIRNSRPEVLAALRDPKFDPRQTVLLESSPDPQPPQAPRTQVRGRAWVGHSSTDWLEINADLRESAILLVTDAYSKYWRAEAIDPGPQENYNVMPADYTLRAIPLAAGHHHILLKYSPIGYNIGKWITIVSLLAWLYLMIRLLIRSSRNQSMIGDAQVSAAVVAAV
jgi:hypothetical protein